MKFGLLAVVVAAGLAGPLFACSRRFAPPVVVGELLAGVVIGRSGFDVVDGNDPLLQLLSDIGFALLMLVVGTHLPLRNAALRPALTRGAAAAALTVVVALAGGAAIDHVVHLHRPVVLALLLATSSAAAALPAVQQIGREDPPVLVATVWITIADVGTVLAIPLVLPSAGLLRVLIGGAAIAALAAAAYLTARWLGTTAAVGRLRACSREGGWALDLRVSLLVLFTLSWVANQFGTSVLVAGFGAGVVLALVGEPRRLAQQLIGLGEGFLIPLFFVTLGARLDLGAVARQPRNLLLLGLLAAGSTALHLSVAATCRLPLAVGLLATAQLGVPAAIAQIGLSTRALDQGEAAAILGAAVASLVACSVGAALLARPQPEPDRGSPNLSH